MNDNAIVLLCHIKTSHEICAHIAHLWGFWGIYKGPEGRNVVRTSNKKISKAPEERNIRYVWYKEMK